MHIMRSLPLGREKIHFFGALPGEFDHKVKSWDWPAFRAAQVRNWVYEKHVTNPEQMSNLSKAQRQRLIDEVSFFTAEIAVHQSSNDGTQKLLLRWADGGNAETVMIPDGDRRTACISSQVGCPVGCKFCASGVGGVKGNLTAGQIVEQVFALNQFLAPKQQHIGNIVFMGMGEPLANYANVMQAVRILHDPDCFNIGARKITISTVGVPAKMRQLAEEKLPLNLAISLHAPNETLRRELIPWAEHFALDEILDAARYYFDRTGREVTLEYILLSGVNDQPEHARQFVKVCQTLRANVNLIRYNEVEVLPYKRPKAEDVVEFQSILRRSGVNAHVRKSRGRDIDAACGQLRRRAEQTAFTLMETLVLIGIFVILLSIFIPYIESIRENSRRRSCENNLNLIRDALQNYARDNDGYAPRVRSDPDTRGYTAFTGADAGNPQYPNSVVQPNDVSASLWLLVRGGYIPNPRTFICPSSDNVADSLTDAAGNPVDPKMRGNFRSRNNLSYSYASPFSNVAGYSLKPDRVSWDFAVVADLNPGTPAAGQPFDAPVAELSKANSPNHNFAGQNVLYGFNYVSFQRTPYSGVGFKTPPGDNIYTARTFAATQPSSQPASVIGFVGPANSPSSGDDSFLVPAATDVFPVIATPATTRAATTSTTAQTSPTTTTSQP